MLIILLRSSRFQISGIRTSGRTRASWVPQQGRICERQDRIPWTGRWLQNPLSSHPHDLNSISTVKHAQVYTRLPVLIVVVVVVVIVHWHLYHNRRCHHRRRRQRHGVPSSSLWLYVIVLNIIVHKEWNSLTPLSSLFLLSSLTPLISIPSLSSLYPPLYSLLFLSFFYPFFSLSPFSLSLCLLYCSLSLSISLSLSLSLSPRFHDFQHESISIKSQGLECWSPSIHKQSSAIIVDRGRDRRSPPSTWCPCFHRHFRIKTNRQRNQVVHLSSMIVEVDRQGPMFSRLPGAHRAQFIKNFVIHLSHTPSYINYYPDNISTDKIGSTILNKCNKLKFECMLQWFSWRVGEHSGGWRFARGEPSTDS